MQRQTSFITRAALAGPAFLLLLLVLAVPRPGRAAAPALEKTEKHFQLRCIRVITRDECGDPLNYPAGLYYDKYTEEVYVTCTGERQLVVFTQDFYPLVSAGKGRGVGVARSCGSDPETIFICSKITIDSPDDEQSTQQGVILTLNRALLPTGMIEFRGLPGQDEFFPLRARPVGKRIFVVGSGRDGLIITDRKGLFKKKITPVVKVLGIPEKATLRSFTFDRQKRLYLLSEDLGTIFVFSPTGEFLFRFGEKGGSSGKLSRPRGIAVNDRLQLVFVVDYMRHAVNIYNFKGDYLFEIGGQGNRRGWFSFPSDVCVDGRGRLWVADTFNQRLQIFTCEATGPPPDTLPTEEIEEERDENEIQNFPTEESPESGDAGTESRKDNDPDCGKSPI